ncbi:MAG: hypothetical protein HKN23_17535 [Verrucomicrobiales bacterium]|nr:hypothetical protein [Verrucomicrobiales bacterium]
MSDSSEQPQTVSSWNLWRNPIFRRYCKSQLRPVSTAIWAITVLVFTTFCFLMVYIGTTQFGDSEPREAARLAMIPVLVIQGLILMLIGTGATTIGYVREADEGITEYQRLTPMKPLAKVLGFLFGLPIRSYLLVGLTMPFTIFCVVKGEIPMRSVLEVYTMFFVSGILYHLTGLLAGTVLKRRLMAGVLSMGLVFCINFVLPAILRRSGYQFLFYTTVWPVLQLHGSGLMLDSVNPVPTELKNFNADSISVQFFNWNIPTFFFGLIVQGFLIFTFGLIIYRKWKSERSHLLSKNFTVLAYSGILILFLGTSLPLMETGRIFPSMSTQFGQNYMRPLGMQGSFPEGWGLAGFCGLVTLIIANILIQIVTPNRDGLIKGLRRAHKENLSGPGFGADEATALWHTIVIAVLGAVAWFWFTDSLFDSKWYDDHSLPGHAFFLMLPVFLFATVCFVCTLQMSGKGALWMAMLFAWIVPLLAAGVLFAAKQYVPGIYLTSPSAFAAFFSSLAILLDGPDFENLKHLKATFWIWLALHAFLSLLLVAMLQSRQSQLKHLILGESGRD